MKERCLSTSAALLARLFVMSLKASLRMACTAVFIFANKLGKALIFLTTPLNSSVCHKTWYYS